jgi:tetratricopeptide (TPR) repeat protein
LTLRRITYILSVTAVSVCLFAGCSAEKNTGSTRFYHALISKYNIYFNGYEAYKKGIVKVKAANRDDYTNLLPVFEYSSPESAGACSAEMERVVQKTSKVIALHSITAKPDKTKRGDPTERDEAFMKQKEYNVWVDDSYLLMAKAQFYQKNFSGSRTTISYLNDLTTDPDLLTEASIWYSRILIEENNYGEAARTLGGISEPESLNSGLKAMLWSTYADLAIKQKKYSDAVVYLENTVKNSSDKYTRARLTYLLAQVCQKEGDDAKSTRYFREVISMNPPYELEFNAGINLAGVADISSGGEAADLKKILVKMLNDSKNKEYLDQIYFAIGELSRRQGKITEAVDYYLKSAHKSISNMRQKARAYLALGSYYYSVPDYVSAQRYYDSTVYLIDNTYPDYVAIKDKADNLNEFIGFHSIVVREDSLRKVALMAPSERQVLIAGIIQDVQAKQSSDKIESARDMSNMGRSYENEQRYQSNISAEGSWYFYNQAALTFGRTEFKRRWGDRKLEDNWRRQNKARVTVLPEEEKTEPGKEAEKGDLPSDQTQEYYLKALPLTDSLMSASFEKSTTASLNEGKTMVSRLRDTLRAVKSFEAALIPGAGSLTRAEALYQLYITLRVKDPSAATRWRDRLISEYPDSEYAKILSDPDYVRKQTEAAGLCAAMYENAWYRFSQDSYNDVVAICDEALVKYPDNELVPKFLLLRAMATGGISGEMAYKTALDSLVAHYPSTPEGARASEIIAFLKKEKPQIQIAEDTKIAESIYSYDSLQPHYVLIIAANPSANMNQMVFDVINYNLDNFQSKNYRTEGALESGKYIYITVGTFGNEADALIYLKSFDPASQIRGSAEAGIRTFIISRDNLEKFRSDKSMDRYLIFYEKNYQINN